MVYVSRTIKHPNNAIIKLVIGGDCLIMPPQMWPLHQNSSHPPFHCPRLFYSTVLNSEPCSLCLDQLFSHNLKLRKKIILKAENLWFVESMNNSSGSKVLQFSLNRPLGRFSQ